MTKIVKSRDRKVNTIVMLAAGETEFIDRKIDHNDPEKNSRSAILRLLIHKAMENPALLDSK